jgi:AcrR family transcriptional regulator
LRGAAEAFARCGFAHTSMEDVAAACGVSRLILYRHFETKEELYRSVLQEVFDRLGEEMRAGLALGVTWALGARTLLTVAREEPAAFTLLWRHAAREPQFADYASDLRSLAVNVVHQYIPMTSGDPVMDRWKTEVLFTWLVETTLSWLEMGSPERDDAFIEEVTQGLVALRNAWAGRP